ncbi:hypothetical protein ACS5NO_04400 [Larkinella sp. GY13]|uniref:hypothetical protein n=1 Tax=Larkinella sp. GY13 TaxID=3453720 RepID=UPI003EEF8A73
MERVETPLQDFFWEWQSVDRAEHHDRITVDAYFTLLDALGRGIGLGSSDELYALCKGVLFKPNQDADQFDQVFKQYFGPTTAPVSAPESNSSGAANAFFSPENGESSAQPEKTAGSGSGENENRASSSDVLKTGGTSRTTFSTEFTEVNLRFNASLSESDTVSAAGPLPEPSFLPGRYSPVDSRKVQQQIRTLREDIIASREFSIDLAATAKRVGKRGFFDRFEQQHRFKNRIPLTVWIDQQGSMVAFHRLCDELTESLRLQFPKLPVYYFRNYPLYFLYPDKLMADPIDLDAWVDETPNTQLLIISDAGAARGFFSPERVEYTAELLNRLERLDVVWLNPMPRSRWWGTSAAQIARRVPMFAVDEQEFTNAFKRLKQ